MTFNPQPKEGDKPKKRRKRIAAYSTKRAKQVEVYKKRRRIFLDKPENKYCFIDRCNDLATTIEHTAGRSGEMLLNEKYWKPCCLRCNLELENNPELSKKYQLSRIHKGKR